MPEPYTSVSSKLIPLAAENVDTDQIIPARFLKTTEKSGLADALFNDWRYLPDGSPDPDFVLNRPQYKGSSILLGRKNFGCGSSREHAPWALMEWGFRCLIAPSYADIFFTNSFKNGLLPLVLREDEVDRLFHECAAFPGFRLVVDLEKQSVSPVDASFAMHFQIDPFRKYCLLNGLDEIGLTLRHADKIRAYESRRSAELPWLFR